jgi:hypothetical protein
MDVFFAAGEAELQGRAGMSEDRGVEPQKIRAFTQ